MTLFSIKHPDGTISTRESNKDLRWAVVVYTPTGTRHEIQKAMREVLEAGMDNIHRALADGTRSNRNDRTHIGGIKAPDEETLLETWDETLEWLNNLSTDLPDLYQATHWFEARPDALRSVVGLQAQYDATPWSREVYYTDELHREG